MKRKQENKQSIDKIREILSELYKFNFKFGIINKVIGVDFIRCFEYSYVLSRLDTSNQRLLYIGETAYGFFSLFLASKGAEVTIMDIDGQVSKLSRKADRLNLSSKVNIVISDARKMPFPDSFFDSIFCISTIEHIPGDGDMRVMKEISRVCKPGGQVYISTHHGDDYSESRWGRWFARYYDNDALENRLLKQTGLEVLDTSYYIGDSVQPFSKLLYRLPRLIRFSTGWSHILFAKFFLERDNADQDNADIVCMLLKK